MCLAPRGFISMAQIRPLLLSAAQHCGVPRLWIRMFSALIFLLPAAEAWSGEGMVHHIAMTLMGQPDDGSPVSTHVAKSNGSQVQMVANYQVPLGYFLDELPADFDLSKAPAGAKEVAIAKARALETSKWLGGRDQSGAPPTDRPRDKLFIRMRVLEVRSGSAIVGKEYDIYFGEWGRDLIFPITPDQLARDYIVAMYLDPLDAKHRLIGFPISSTQYRDWSAKVSEYERSRYKK
jgi:hypothetical protein